MTDEVLTFVDGRAGRIRLNRPRPIHALTTAMCQAITDALLAWQDDDRVQLILLDHAEGRGFCAGGDVRMVAESGKADGADARRFFFVEYRMNHLMFTYDKPIVAVMDGITMGGGVGLSLPASYRVATENTRFAMPETSIGLFPDVGGGWYLSRLPGRTGQFLALTGARMDGPECLKLGLATHYVEASGLDGIKAALVQDDRDIDQILGQASITPPEARIAANMATIDRHFRSDRLEDILASLEGDGGQWASKELGTLRSKSPLSCKVSLRLLAESAGRKDFADEMRLEYAIAARICQSHDFIEGVRALLVDKDNQPRWDPPTPEGVTDAMLDRIFAPLPDGESWTPISA